MRLNVIVATLISFEAEAFAPWAVPRSRSLLLQATQSVTTSAPASAIREDLLVAISNTDRGAAASGKQLDDALALYGRLEDIGRTQDCLSDPSLFDNYRVAFARAGGNQSGAPAGGRYRGRVGRALFRTEDLFQHIVSPDTVVNMVLFKLFGLIPGCVTLRGTFEPIGDSPGFVCARFEPPRVTLGGATLCAGPSSSVKLATPYLDSKIRLGKGSRGSIFVFTRCTPGDAPKAELWRKYCGAKALPVGKLMAVTAAAAGALLWRFGAVAGAVPAALALLLAVWRGGIA